MIYAKYKDIQSFKNALSEEYLIGANEAIANQVWSLAWDEGHANGFHEIECHYINLSDLVNFVIAEFH